MSERHPQSQYNQEGYTAEQNAALSQIEALTTLAEEDNISAGQREVLNAVVDNVSIEEVSDATNGANSDKQYTMTLHEGSGDNKIAHSLHLPVSLGDRLARYKESLTNDSLDIEDYGLKFGKDGSVYSAKDSAYTEKRIKNGTKVPQSWLGQLEAHKDLIDSSLPSKEQGPSAPSGEAEKASTLVPSVAELEKGKDFLEGLTYKKGKYYDSDGHIVTKKAVKTARQIYEKDWVISDPEEKADFAGLIEADKQKNLSDYEKELLDRISDEYSLPAGKKKQFRAAQAIAKAHLELSDALLNKEAESSAALLQEMTAAFRDKKRVPTAEELSTLQNFAMSLKPVTNAKGKLTNYRMGEHVISKKQAHKLIGLADPNRWSLNMRSGRQRRRDERRGVAEGVEYAEDFADAHFASKRSELSDGSKQLMEEFVASSAHKKTSRKEQFAAFQRYVDQRLALDAAIQQEPRGYASRQHIEATIEGNGEADRQVPERGIPSFLGQIAFKETIPQPESNNRKWEYARRIGRLLMQPAPDALPRSEAEAQVRKKKK